MAIEDFLENLGKKRQDDQQKLSKIKQEKEGREKEINDYLLMFENYYNKTLKRNFEVIEKKLRKDFVWGQRVGIMPIQYKSYQLKITLTPTSSSETEIVIISITANGESKLIQFIATLPDTAGFKSRAALNHFELPFEEFIKMDIDAEIDKALSKAYL